MNHAGSRTDIVREPWPLNERPGFLIRRLHQFHVALFMEACGAFNVTPLQYSLLCALSDRGVADQTTLAAAVALDRTTTTGALKRLASRNLIERVVNGKDGRARSCRLTPTGVDLLGRMEEAARDAHRKTLARLNKEDERLFIAMMQQIIGDSHAPDTVSSEVTRQ